VPHQPGGVDARARMARNVTETLRRDLEACIEGEVRFDAVTRALYSTDASVYQIEPIGAVIVKSRQDLLRVVERRRHHCPLTMRAAALRRRASHRRRPAGRYFEVLQPDSRTHAEEQWVRVQPGIVLDELNAALKSHGLRFAPDVSTASRATIGGMIANNSSGARSVLYARPSTTSSNWKSCWRMFGRAAGYGWRCAGVLPNGARTGDGKRGRNRRRFPKVLRRVGGYNLDEFLPGREPFNLAKMIVGSEGTLAVILERS